MLNLCSSIGDTGSNIFVNFLWLLKLIFVSKENESRCVLAMLMCDLFGFYLSKKESLLTNILGVGGIRLVVDGNYGNDLCSSISSLGTDNPK